MGHAIAIRATRPDLAGLPLLRAAVAMIPAERRRKVTTLAHAPWFEEAIAEAIVRQRDTDQDDRQVLVAQTIQGIAEKVDRMESRAEEYGVLLTAILRELQTINAQRTVLDMGQGSQEGFNPPPKSGSTITGKGGPKLSPGFDRASLFEHLNH